MPLRGWGQTKARLTAPPCCPSSPQTLHRYSLLQSCTSKGFQRGKADTQLPILSGGRKGTCRACVKPKIRVRAAGSTPQGGTSSRATCAELSSSTKIPHGTAGQSSKVSSFIPENSLDNRGTTFPALRAAFSIADHGHYQQHKAFTVSSGEKGALGLFSTSHLRKYRTSTRWKFGNMRLVSEDGNSHRTDGSCGGF